MQNLSRMICIEPQVLSYLLKNPHLATGSELVSLGQHNALLSYFDSSLIELSRFDAGLTFCSSKVLDVYAAFVCVEHLEPRHLDTDEQRQAWLQLVKKLQVPIELVCSEESLRLYGEKSQTIVHRVQ